MGDAKVTHVEDEWLPFLCAIRAMPGDWLPWRLFTEWLDEQGHTATAEALRTYYRPYVDGPERGDGR